VEFAITFSQILPHCNRFESWRGASSDFALAAASNPAETEQKLAVFSHVTGRSAQA
jgi:hypothetical protein|tara:strand:+ start:4382 stop:4549 length:168 start_codon:yes stop_codon:yes gene_type:complete